MDELYRDYRISMKQTDKWVARVTHVRGTRMPLDAHSTLAEGPALCLQRARKMVDQYIEFLKQDGVDGEAT